MELTRVAQGGPDPVTVQHAADRQRASFGTSLESAGVQKGTPLAHEVDAAWRRGAELKAQGRELHFRHDEDTGRLVIEVRDTAGEVVRRIPANEALAILAGKRPH